MEVWTALDEDTPQEDSLDSKNSSRQTNADSPSEIETEIEMCQKEKQVLKAIEPTTPCPALNCTKKEEVEDPEHFMSQAEKLLNRLYGKTWQTPKVIRTLQRASGSGGQKSTNTAEKSPSAPEPSKANVSPKTTAEETILDDFSIFQRRIVQTNLDSTCLTTPKRHVRRRDIGPQLNSEPKRAAPKKTACGLFAVPQTDIKKRAPPGRGDRIVKERWRKLVDKDSESDGNNASDDASRNLMDLLTDNAVEGESADGGRRTINLLLRSDSSSKADTSAEATNSLDNDDTVLNTLDEDAWKDKLDLNLSNNSVSMEPLQVTEDLTQIHDHDQNVIDLTQMISSMGVSTQPPQASTATTQIGREPEMLFPSLVKEECSIYVSSTSDEDSSECDSDDAIIISDSSIDSTENANIEVDLITSNIMPSGNTMDGFLPSTFSNDKADRMEAFLRDVSQERRELKQNMDLQGGEGAAGKYDIATADTESMQLAGCSANCLSPKKETLEMQKETTEVGLPQMLATADTQSMCQLEHNFEDDNATREALARRFATADTKSMSISDEHFDLKAPTSPERKNRLLALDDTASMSQSQTSLHFTMDQNSMLQSPQRLMNDKNQRLALNETEPNSLIASTSKNLNNSHDNSLPQNDVSSTLGSSNDIRPPPTDSLIIPETSIEDDNSVASNKEIKLSEQTSEYTSTVSKPTQRQLQLGMGVTNISAKINIKIHVSQQSASEQEEDVAEEENCSSLQDEDTPQEDSLDSKNSSRQTNADSPSEIETEIEMCQKEKQVLKAIEPTTPCPALNCTKKEEVEDPEHFMSQAEKLLNRLYGKTWQTPKVIRTLQRASGSGGQKSTNTAEKSPSAPEPSKANVSPKTTAEETILDDFSIFQRRIVQTNLDSTCLTTPKRHVRRRDIGPQLNSEPKRAAPKKTACGLFAVPQTDIKKRAPPGRGDRIVKERWRKLVDKDSESDGNNASDDASRNLMDLLTDNAVEGESADGGRRTINLLLRSDSSSKADTSAEATNSLDNDDTVLNTLDEDAWKDKLDLNLSNNSVSMEPLQVTEDLTQIHDHDQNVIDLTQMISSMGVSTQPPQASTATTQIGREPEMLFPSLVKEECSIYVSSTSDEDSSECDSDDAIIISDSSIDSTENANIEVDLITSNIMPSGNTMDGFLPSTFSNDKADRMEAFLRDVSQERRELKQNMDLQGGEGAAGKYDIATADTESMQLAGCSANCLSPKKETLEMQKETTEVGLPQMLATADTQSMCQLEHNFEDDNATREALARRFATADTKSMSISDEHFDLKAPTSPERKNRLLALDDTASMSQSQTSLHFTMDQNSMLQSPQRLMNDKNQRLALNETEPNSLIASTSKNLNNSHDNSLPQNDVSSTLGSSNDIRPPPTDSLIIPETSIEDDNSVASNKEIKLSEQTSEYTSTVSKPTQRQLQLGMGVTNISAKINIKIHVSQQSASEQEEDVAEEENCSSLQDEDTPQEDSLDSKNSSRQTNADSPSEIETEIEMCQKEKQVLKAIEPTTPCPALNCTKKEEVEDPEHFMSQAEKLLNRLYGKTWQTPKVIRTLQRASGSGGQKSTNTAEKSPSAPEPSKANVSPKTTAEETILYDFSIFQRRIVQTNLDSTRLTTPKRHVRRRDIGPQLNSEPKRAAPKKTTCGLFAVPQTDIKKRAPPGRGDRIVKERWRELVDKDSESDGNNASDDDDADRTENGSSSAHSWSGGSTSGSDSYDDSDGKPTGSKTAKKPHGPKKKQPNESLSNVVYLDLSKHEVSVLESTPTSLAVNDDANFKSRLEDILRTCRAEPRPKLTSIATAKTKRKLFTPNIGYEEDHESNDVPLTPGTPKAKSIIVDAMAQWLTIDKLRDTPDEKYSFLGSLDVRISKCFCHPDALQYRDNYRTIKEDLAHILYDLYNEKLFDNALDVPIKWNNKLLKTAGRCLNKTKMGHRLCVVELSEKVLTSPDRLRCTLVHELCHAATWIFNGEGGHGVIWKNWARKANSVFPELPKIGVCHQYDIEYKYTYKCTLCAAKSHAHSKSKKGDNIRCAYCHGAIEVFLNKKNKAGEIMQTPVREPTGFAKFVKDHYKKYRGPDITHADVMKILSNEFAALKGGQQ